MYGVVLYNDQAVKAVVKIRKSELFFGWIVDLGSTVHIAVPKASRKNIGSIC